jgi:opacity protein-like surface antigen
MLARQASAFIFAAFAASSACAQAYLGLSIGQAKFKNPCAGVPGSISCDSNDTSFRVLGGYQMSPNVAIEAGYSDLGTVHASNGDTAELSAFDVSAIGSWPVGNRFALLGRLGGYRGDSRVSLAPPPPVPAVFPPPPPPPNTGWSSAHSTNLTYGLGASYDMTHSATLRLEWQRFKDLGGVPKIDIDVLAIGALMRY